MSQDLPFGGSGEDRSILFVALLGALCLHGVLLSQDPGRREFERQHSSLLIDAQLIEQEPEALPEPEVAPVADTPDETREPSDAPPSPSAADPAATSEPSGEANGDPESDTSIAEAAEMVTSDVDGSDWSLLSGHGDALSGGGPRQARPGHRTGQKTTLKARDLSRAAEAPDLSRWVLQNYPPSARMAREEGSATVTALLSPTGRPSDVRVQNVSTRGLNFGETCSRTVLEGPSWRPELNVDGRPVSARVSYTCRFILPEEMKRSAADEQKGIGANRVWSHGAP